ncbi:MAG: pantoate--beta-alanine ligase [Fimbriimonas sp.]
MAAIEHPANVTTGFVPTMGAFHEGHLQLMRRAKEENDRCVVSLFVNPTQFGKNEDFSKYPRNLERDAELAESVGVDILFAPTPEEVYPRASSMIHVPEVTERWEGAHRPGHFDGVATVVCKLFNMVQPTTSYFGLKDLQQCMVVQRMSEDLNLPYALKFEPTVREPDGLAMSSRNAYLTEEQRAVAPMIYRQLTRCKDALVDGSLAATELSASEAALKNAGFAVDYFELVELPSMQPVPVWSSNSAIIVTARLGTTRLLDNILF